MSLNPFTIFVLNGSQYIFTPNCKHLCLFSGDLPPTVQTQMYVPWGALPCMTTGADDKTLLLCKLRETTQGVLPFLDLASGDALT